jgi:hypothetical protein
MLAQISISMQVKSQVCWKRRQIGTLDGSVGALAAELSQRRQVGHNNKIVFQMKHVLTWLLKVLNHWSFSQ